MENRSVSNMVWEFMQTNKQYIGDFPHWPEDKTLQLRMELIREEYDELWKSVHARDMVETADALCDLTYVVVGMAIALGIDFDRCFDAVHQSNMSKLGEDGKPVYDENGKVVKGPAYQPPDIKGALGL